MGIELCKFKCDGVADALDLTAGKRLKSREACGVWIFRDKAWKIFPSRGNQYDKLCKEYKRAEDRNLPLPAGTKIVKGLATPSKGRAREGFALVSTYITSSTRFSLKSNTKSFKGTVDSISDVRILKKIEEGLGTAVNIGLTDPQGFIDPTSTSNPIVFIDIHTNNLASKEVREVYEYVSQRRSHIEQQSRG